MPVAVVTGGSRGIGRGIVLALASRGYTLIVNYRDREDAALETCRLASIAGAADAVPVRADISNPTGAAEIVDQAFARFGRVDSWINNAGVAPRERRDLLETTRESWDEVLSIDLSGPFFLTQRVARAMIGQGPAEDGSRPSIVFVTSVSSEFASVARGEYCVAKAGLSMVARLFAVRLAEHGIAVFEVRPGIIETDMTASVRDTYDRKFAAGMAPIARWGTPEDVGRVIALLASGGLGYSTGEVFHVDGGLHLPRL